MIPTSTGCALPALRRAALHPWLQSAAPSGRKGVAGRASPVATICRPFGAKRSCGPRFTRGYNLPPLRGEKELPRDIQPEVYRFFAKKFDKTSRGK